MTLFVKIAWFKAGATPNPLLLCGISVLEETPEGLCLLDYVAHAPEPHHSLCALAGCK